MSSWFGLRGRDAPAPPASASAPPPPTPGRALQLVSVRADGAFEVGADAAAALTAIRGPVGVVAVAGRARQGKSYILNQLVGAGGGAGFAVAPTQKPCTKGLWLWSAPLARRDEEGRPYQLVRGLIKNTRRRATAWCGHLPPTAPRARRPPPSPSRPLFVPSLRLFSTRKA
jgi:hypothetical protein